MSEGDDDEGPSLEKLNLSFTLLIAYVVPGLLGAIALEPRFEQLKRLLAPANTGLTAAAIVPLLLLCLAVGVVLNAFSWAVIRTMIHATGVKAPALPYWRMTPETIPVYQEFVESNFRFYQAYSNLLGALILLSVSSLLDCWPPPWWEGLLVLVVISLLFAAARDSLSRSYRNLHNLLNRKEPS